MNYDKIGNFIQQKRKSKNLTQKQLAEKLGVTDRAISKWERGQGCPDVSILEILSKELGCSILELLKGREIENEVISVTEADDYVRDSMHISSEVTKNRIVSILNKVIVTSIIFIVLLLSYLNIVQLCYVSRKSTMKINFIENKDIKTKEEVIEKNLEIIKNNRGIFSKNDHMTIFYGLQGMFNNIKNGKLYNHVRNRKDITYTVNDILILAEGDVLTEEINLTTRLEKYVDDDRIENYRNMVSNEYYASLHSVNNLSAYSSYKYRLNYGDDNYIYGYGNDDITSLIFKMRYNISRIIHLTELVMEVGEIHE